MKHIFSRLKFIVLIFLYLLVGQSALQAAAVLPPEQSYDAVIAEAKKGGYRLIKIDKLWQVYQQTGDELILVDTRQDWEYHAGCIKGAVNFSMEPTWLARLKQRGALDLPVAPAIMVGEEITTEGKDVDDHEVEAAICRQLGLPEPAKKKKGFLSKMMP